MNEQKKESFWGEIFKFTFLALLVVLPVRLFIAQPFIVSGASMEPTFEGGEYLIVNQLSHRFKEMVRGEVVIFKYPKDPSKFFIKRIIGLPGETVVLSGQKIIIKNTEYPAGFTISEPYISDLYASEDDMTVTLKEKEYFVMGDNRRQSSDSRMWGTLSEDLIIGTPFIRLFPLTRISVSPGDHQSDK